MRKYVLKITYSLINQLRKKFDKHGCFGFHNDFSLLHCLHDRIFVKSKRDARLYHYPLLKESTGQMASVSFQFMALQLWLADVGFPPIGWDW